MKRQLFTLLLLLGFSFCTATAQTSTLVLTHPNGKTTEVELYSQPHIRLLADKMTITSSTISLEYDKADVVRFHYKNLSNGISTLEHPASYRVSPEGVVFHGLNTTDRITLFSIDGTQLPANLTVRGSNAILPLSQLPRGAYIVNFNGKTFKFIRP